ncbi:phage tail terminator protein [Adlercreutzia equolifaciens]|jgi:hypothetical protein|uniref:Tail terminator n=1 Tax=Adlercreutzia equolifaciens subsp. celatus DSM 18785 TaxID=1121021 RepID=A0A3N0AN92_9ACTN|nr:minor capsid protein [Adlercreutzia equolifaciens]RFT93188.1 hypothetical protein DX904_04735 [Adlercreutzia equolifaciens subsp. celatus]RNL36047.1 hypothetical protein DMP10_11300 [Adlercreutzia equolifaciens subsp. celatus DSM 18785]
MMAAMDLLDVMRKRLEEAGIADVFTTMPDGRRYPESVTLAFGIPDRKTVYYDGTTTSPMRVTVIVKRLSEFNAMATAQEAEAVLKSSPLDSENGSYDLDSVETTDPQPLPWDESGRYVWAFDVYIDTRKDFF